MAGPNVYANIFGKTLLAESMNIRRLFYSRGRPDFWKIFERARNSKSTMRTNEKQMQACFPSVSEQKFISI